MDGVALGPLANNIGTVGLCVLITLGFITDRIVSGKRLRRVEDDRDKRIQKVEDDRDRWEGVALKALGAAQVVVPAAEIVHKIASNLPDPGAEADDMPEQSGSP